MVEGTSHPNPSQGRDPNQPYHEAETSYGPVKGSLRANDRIADWRGIPYAAPPVGDLRWRAPQPPEPWTKTKNCTKFGPRAYNRQAASSEVLTNATRGLGLGRARRMLLETGARFRSTDQNEDCLTLNVRAPAGAEGLPVMVWIHGGNHTDGTGSDSSYDTNVLPERGCVVVTFNYRLGLFGFFAHPALSEESPDGVSGNYGLLDQIAVLEWVRDNIANFGGNPDQVTIFGESAGGQAVLNLMTSPRARGLFHRAIAQSPSDSGRWLYLRHHSLDFEPAEEAGLRFGEAALALQAENEGDASKDDDSDDTDSNGDRQSGEPGFDQIDEPDLAPRSPGSTPDENGEGHLYANGLLYNEGDLSRSAFLNGRAPFGPREQRELLQGGEPPDSDLGSDVNGDNSNGANADSNGASDDVDGEGDEPLDDLGRLRAMKADDLMDLYRQDMELGRYFYPVVDEVILPTAPMSAFLLGTQAPVPLMIGCTANEASVFAGVVHPAGAEFHIDFFNEEAQLSDEEVRGTFERSYPTSHHVDQLMDAYPGLADRDPEAVITHVSDHLFGAHVEHAAREHYRAGYPVYRYHFRAVPPSPKQTLGAFHSFDVLYVFDSSYPLVPEANDKHLLARQMGDRWFAFAATGVPDFPGLPPWPVFDAANPLHMVLDRPRCSIEPCPPQPGLDLMRERIAWLTEQHEAHIALLKAAEVAAATAETNVAAITAETAVSEPEGATPVAEAADAAP